MSYIPQPLQSGDLDSQGSTRTSDGPDLLTQVEVCRRLGISDETWMRWRKAGKAPEGVTMPSGRVKWRTADIDRLTHTPTERTGSRRYFGSVYRKQCARQVVSVVAHGERTVAAPSAQRNAKSFAVKPADGKSLNGGVR